MAIVCAVVVEGGGVDDRSGCQMSRGRGRLSSRRRFRWSASSVHRGAAVVGNGTVGGWMASGLLSDADSSKAGEVQSSALHEGGCYAVVGDGASGATRVPWLRNAGDGRRGPCSRPYEEWR